MPRTARNQAAVIAHGTGPETRLVGFVVLDEDGTDLSLLSVSTHLADRLPAHMVPAALIPLDHFPLTLNGKLDHAVLAARAAQTLPATSGTTPDQDTDDLVAVIADIWSEILGAGPLGPTDDFFALGGDSFRAVREREARTGLQVPVHLVFEASEVAEFAVAIAEDTETAGTSGRGRAGTTSGAHGRRRGGRERRQGATAPP
ncbi:phosphopantetheine-binding protein [Streptomyces sp. CMSTAAHL-2]|uniref:phosphopantetheine-binding protein n=1 Tax=Streptomyces sp. CMSTAAHL-2 TaxID=2904522 RepID=UPI001E588D33|nr:phosphopantetheine-binding protein [Streptomyces sp. CMSTAAHL-2]MCE3031194.1 phosphopantetheine-binding protein [Streptomyces sp. CMSTAAHL-2]